MSTGVKLRIMTPDLFPQWKQLRNSLYSGLDDEHHEREMALIHGAEDQHCYAAVSTDDRLVGFVEVSLRNIVDGCIGGPVGYVEGLYVRPERRSHGIGRALLDRALQWFRECGCTEVATDSEIDDTEAQAYWQRMGFEETWRVVQFRREL